MLKLDKILEIARSSGLELYTLQEEEVEDYLLDFQQIESNFKRLHDGLECEFILTASKVSENENYNPVQDVIYKLDAKNVGFSKSIPMAA